MRSRAWMCAFSSTQSTSAASGGSRVETDDVAHLLDELGIVGQLEVLHAMRLEASTLPTRRRPALREETGKLDGGLAIGEDVLLRGMVTGNAVVARGCRLEVAGMICGNLKLDAGAAVAVRGMVLGTITNGGELAAWGIVNGGIDDVGGRNVVHPGAVIRRQGFRLGLGGSGQRALPGNGSVRVSHQERAGPLTTYLTTYRPVAPGDQRPPV